MKKAALLLLVFALAGCGSSSDSTAGKLAKLTGHSLVDRAETNLASGVFSGGDMPRLTTALTAAIRQARSDGVSDSWLGKQIDSAESEVADCANCVTLLENAR